MQLGVTEIILLVVILLLFFGPSKLPQLGKSLGQAVRAFRKPNDKDSVG
jgi:sec-independent protein translocase protein TatA